MKSKQTLILISISLILLALIPTWVSRAAPPAQAELTEISFPANGAVVRGTISIRGSAVHPSFDRFQVAYAAEPVTDNNQWIIIGIERTDQVVNGELAIWNTNTIPDGSYSLRLRVVRLDGNYGEMEIKNVAVINTQPTETPTPEESPTPRAATATPTSLPPTPTILIEVPVEDTPTPRPLTTTLTLPTPRPTTDSLIPIPKVNLDTAPLKSGCLWGGGGMFALFVLFGFLSALRLFILGFAKRFNKRV